MQVWPPGVARVMVLEAVRAQASLFSDRAATCKFACAERLQPRMTMFGAAEKNYSRSVNRWLYCDFLSAVNII